MKRLALIVAAIAIGCGGPEAAEDIPCEAGKTPCGGVCVSPLFDAMNCGGCGKACGGDTGCFGGACTSPSPLLSPRMAVALVTGEDGLIYALGGVDRTKDGTRVLETVEAYDPETNVWTERTSMNDARGHAGAALRSGKVLAIGGATHVDGELHVPTPNVETHVETDDGESWTGVKPLSEARSAPAVSVADGAVWVFWGKDGLAGPLGTQEVSSGDGAEFVKQGQKASQPRWGARAVTLADGRILVMGGSTDSMKPWGVATVSVFDPTTGEWGQAPPMNHARNVAGAALGADGRVYCAGGYGETTELKSAEVYDPATSKWSSIADLPYEVVNASAVADRNGRIYVAGGELPFQAEQVSTAFLVYDPALDRWYQ